MPLVRIDVLQTRPEGFAEQVGDVVYRAMMSELNVPPADNFRVATSHPAGGLTYDPNYLGIERTDGIVFIQITLNAGRSVELKKAFYATLAKTLHSELEVRPEDVLINLVEVPKENWSFGLGEAQYA